MNTKYTVLYVEDEPIINQALTTKLTELGVTVHSALNGMSALAQINQVHFDLILLDWMLPDVSGPELLQRFRDNPKTATVPVVILSNRNDPELVGFALEHNVTHYFVKADTGINSLASEILHLLSAQE